MHDIIVLGQLVISAAGRDIEREFLVIGIIDEHYVYISDGDTRKMENPKKKKIKHLRKTKHVFDEINKKIENKEKIENHEIRKLIKSVISGTGGLIT